MRPYYDPASVQATGNPIKIEKTFDETREQLLSGQVMCVVRKTAETKKIVALAIYEESDFKWAKEGEIIGLYAINPAFVAESTH